MVPVGRTMNYGSTVRSSAYWYRGNVHCVHHWSRIRDSLWYDSDSTLPYCDHCAQLYAIPPAVLVYRYNALYTCCNGSLYHGGALSMVPSHRDAFVFQQVYYILYSVQLACFTCSLE